MPEIKCPHCGQIFQVDQSGYADLLSQVRTAEFHQELEARAKQLAREQAGFIKNPGASRQATGRGSLRAGNNIFKGADFLRAHYTGTSRQPCGGGGKGALKR